MKFKLSLIAILVLTFMMSQIQAQESTRVVEDVILFQSEAHLVRMTNKGKILAFIKDQENSYAALNSVTSREIVMSAVEISEARDLGRSAKSLEPLDERTGDKTMMAENNAPSAQETKEPVVVIDEALTGDMTADEEMDALLAEVTEVPDEDMMPKGEKKATAYDYEFAFDHRDASLSPAVVNQLRQIADLLKSDEDANAEIKSYFSETVDVSKILSKNRAKGIQDQLVASGVKRDRIKISESNNADWANNRVQLSIY